MFAKRKWKRTGVAPSLKLFIVCLVSLGLAFSSSSVGLAAELRCTPSFADLENPVPAHFSEAAIREIIRSYSTKEVRGFRSAINAYLAGDADALTARYLRSTPRDILVKRFELMVDDPNIFGGYFLTVRFRQYPKRMYRAWVYDLGTAWQIRAWDVASCSAQEQRWLRIRYSDLSHMTASG